MPHVVEELAELRSLVDLISSDTVTQLCLVIFSSIIVTVSKQDSDTRYVRRDKTISPGDTVRRYLNQLDSAITATQEMSALLEDQFKCEVLHANILKAPKTELFDLVVTSPPYPNAYSYHLYHRTRLIWLGHDLDQFKKIEIGSHRKYRFQKARPCNTGNISQGIRDNISLASTAFTGSTACLLYHRRFDYRR